MIGKTYLEHGRRLLDQPPTTSARAAEWDRAGDVRAALPPALHPGQLTNQ